MKYLLNSQLYLARALAWLLLTQATLLNGVATQAATSAMVMPSAWSRAQVLRPRGHGQLPLSFEANQGQADPRVKFLVRQREFVLSLTPTEATLGAFSLRFVGANPQPHLSGLEELPGKVGYFLGNDPKQWRAAVPTYARVKYASIYPGIDLVFYGNGQQLEYDFIVAPQADPQAIKLRFTGARKSRLDANGDLVLTTKAGEVRQQKPFVYQETNGVKQQVAAHYLLKGAEVSFALGAYDTSKPLVIDPVLSYSTFLGGQATEAAEAIAVDAEGNVYVTGSTTFAANTPFTFPTTPGAPQPALTPPVTQGSFIFVTKLNAQGNTLIYSAIIGGTRGIREYQRTNYLLENRSQAISLDAEGHAYVTGFTHSENFPTTAGVLQATSVPSQLGNEAFVVKLNAAGTALSYSTLLGRGIAEGYGIAVDRQGQAWVTGNTSSRNFPVTADAFQKARKNPNASVFVSKLNTTGTALLYSTFLSSGTEDLGFSVALDANENAYVSGTTVSSCVRAGTPPVEPFPTTEGAFRRDLGDCTAQQLPRFVFVTKFAATGALSYSTLLGGSEGGTVVVDAQGHAYVAGTAAKYYNFPTTPGAFQTEISGTINTYAAFVAKLNPAGSALVYSTFLNGAKPSGSGLVRLAVDPTGAAYVTGSVSDTTFVRTTVLPPFRAPNGVFVTKLNPAGSAANYSVVLEAGESNGIATDARGNAYVAGSTNSDQFPVTPGAFQTEKAAANDVFITKLSEPAAVASAHVSAASYNGARLAGESIIAAFGSGLAMTTEAALTAPLPMSLAGTTIKVRDSAGVERGAPLFFVSPGQVNYLIPPGTASGAAQITVTSGDGTISTATTQIEAVAPGLFTANASGSGLAAAVVLRVKGSGEQSYEPVARYDAAQGWLGVPIELGPETDQVFLILFGTGLRHHSGLNAISAKLGGVAAPVIFVGAQGGLAGLDQINLRLPRNLAGRGEVEIALTVDGVAANAIKVQVK